MEGLAVTGEAFRALESKPQLGRFFGAENMRPGGSQVVDFDGRLLAEASPGPGERIVVAPIDISALRHERAARRGHHMLAHLRTEAYPVYQQHQYPPRLSDDSSAQLSYEKNNLLIDEAKRRLSNSEEDLPAVKNPH